MDKIRYKYKEAKEGFSLKEIRCPVCRSNHINWAKVVQHKSWNGTIILLAECWSGDTQNKKPHHLFLIELNDLPVVEVSKVKSRKTTKKKSSTKRAKSYSKRIRR